MKLIYLTIAIFSFACSTAIASGGYDNGTPVGKGNWDIDFTLNPGDAIENGQSYIVWGYGLTHNLDFHGYTSHEAGGVNQIYYGLMYNFYSNNYLDLSTAAGARHRLGVTDAYFPQLLFTLKLGNDFEIIGSLVNVYNTTDGYNRGLAQDVGFRIPLSQKYTPAFVENIRFTIGMFNPVGSDRWLPTYSIDVSF